MARREKKKQEVSLFPFLDILACVIGNLILIITAVVLEQVDTKPVADAAAYEAKLLIKENQEQQIETLQQQYESMRAESSSRNGDIEQLEQQIVQAEAELKQAQSQMAAISESIPKVDPSLLQEKKLREQEQRQIEADITKIKADIKERNIKPEQSISLLPGKVSSQNGDDPLRSVFVEINKAGLIIYPDQPLWKEKKTRIIQAASIPSDGSLGKLMNIVLGDKTAIVTFFMRPDGLNVYNAVRSRFDNFQKTNQDKLTRPIDAAKPDGDLQLRKLYAVVPLPGEGVLDFSEIRGDGNAETTQ
ncbi:MAG: hypothetical protein ABGW78_10780 [Pirellulales bacterium]